MLATGVRGRHRNVRPPGCLPDDDQAMPSPSPRLLLEMAERLDFDASFRAAVQADPLVALVGAGLDPGTAAELLAGEEVVLFGDSTVQIAARAHRWAMALLRGER